MSSAPSGKVPRRAVHIGKYEVISHIATGGMGAVYKARDVELRRDVALKVLAPELAAKPGLLERFRREARHAARLRHENIVSIYECGETGGTYYLALEFVDGIDLGEYIDREGKLDPEEARLITLQAARALEHAHAHGIIHRDVKPSNFLLARPNGGLLVKLTDLGLAREAGDEDFRVTRAGTTVGTIDYIAPEQARDSALADIRSDLYSLGCTLFHMLAGQAPFSEGGLTERLYKHIESEPPNVLDFNPRVPPALCVVLYRLLAKKPEDRYQTPTSLVYDLLHLDQIKVQHRAPIHRDVLAELADIESPTRGGRSKARVGIRAKQPPPKPIIRRRSEIETREHAAATTRTFAVPDRLLPWILWGGGIGLALLLGIALAVILRGGPKTPPTKPTENNGPAGHSANSRLPEIKPLSGSGGPKPRPGADLAALGLLPKPVKPPE
jgi:serine/threonine protein kinase